MASPQTEERWGQVWSKCVIFFEWLPKWVKLFSTIGCHRSCLSGFPTK